MAEEHEGIDISHNNGTVNLKKAKNDGIEFVMIRMGYGDDQKSQDDEQFEKNVKKAESNNIPWGAYFYSYALTQQDVKSEIKHAKRLMKDKKPQYPVAFDMEDADGYKEKNGMPSNKTLANICADWLNAMEDEGYYVSLYASRTWLENQLDQSNLVKFDKWLADWNKSPQYKYDDYTMWQYTSTGSVNGIPGNVDRNISYTDYNFSSGGSNGNGKNTGFLFPVDNPRRITQEYKQNSHYGVDMAGEKPGDRPKIHAAADGSVTRSYLSTSYGECIILQHKVKGKTWETLYAHMTSGSRKVKNGDTVKQGDTIGKMGETGDANGVHLHFEMHQPKWTANKSNRVDPLKYLSDEPDDDGGSDGSGGNNGGSDGNNPKPPVSGQPGNSGGTPDDRNPNAGNDYNDDGENEDVQGKYNTTYPCRVIVKGSDRDQHIKTIQEALEMDETGDFDGELMDAVKEYQDDNDLPVTGIVDRWTWKAMIDVE